MTYFQYGQREIDYLKKRDKKLAQVIKTIGHIERETNTDVFASLIEIVISQQISAKAAQTISRNCRGTSLKNTASATAPTALSHRYIYGR